MNRVILGVSVVAVVVVALAGATYFIVDNAIKQAKQPAHGGTNVPAPFSYAQLEKMMDAKDAPADSEIPKLIACFDKSEEVPEFGKVPMGIAASEALARIGPGAVEPLRASLKDQKNVKMRYYSAQTLGRMGPIAAPAANDLVARLQQDSDAEVRFKSAFALGQLGLQNDAIIEGLAAALGDSDRDVAHTAVEALEKIGAPALPKMYAIVSTTSGPTRERLIEALVKIGSPPADALPVVVVLVKDPADIVRQPAFKLLAQLGKPAVPTFKELLKKPNPLDVMALPHAVAMLPKEEAKELLPEMQVLLLELRFWDAEPELMGTLKKCGPDGAKTLTNILKTLQDPTSKQFPDSEGRTIVVLRTLGEMGADAKDAVPTLLTLLAERSALQPQILDTLGDIGPAANETKKAAAAVEMLLAKAGQNPELAEKARTALVRMGVFKKNAETPKKDK